MEFKAYFNILTENGTQEETITFGDDVWMCQVCFEEDILKRYNIDEVELTGLSLTGYNAVSDVKMYTWDLSALGNDTVTKWEEVWDWAKTLQAKIDEAVKCFWNNLNDAHIEG